MKVLCLHGKGTSADIFESQTESIRQLLPEHFEYVFPEANWPCPASIFVEKLYPGPYYTWYPDERVRSVARQHEELLEFIEEEGPFDVVMAFSQGAALAASVLLHHELERPHTPPPFRCALFICGTQPFTKSTDMGKDITEEMEEKFPPIPDLSDGSSDEETSEEEMRYRWFDPEVVKTRIQIPTAHIKGAKDDWLQESDDLARLCDRKIVYSHPGGHEVPTRPDVTMKVVETMRKALDETNYFM